MFTRAQLLQEVWGYDYYGGTRTVDVHVRRLRAKLGPEHEVLIGTVRNVGYRFVPDRAEARARPTTRRRSLSRVPRTPRRAAPGRERGPVRRGADADGMPGRSGCRCGRAAASLLGDAVQRQRGVRRVTVGR